MKKSRDIIFLIAIFAYIIFKLIMYKTLSSVFLNVINPILFILITIYLYKSTNDKVSRVTKGKDYIKKMIIIMLSYIIIYSCFGFIFGFVRSPYNHSLIIIIKNIWQMIVPIIGIEYLRNVLIDSNERSTGSLLIIGILFFFIELDILQIISLSSNSEDLFKYLCSTIIPLLFQEMLFNYLTLKTSYKITLTYRILFILMQILLPVFPYTDWFSKGVISILFITIVYMIFKYDIDKRNQRISRRKIKTLNPVLYIPFFAFIFIFFLFNFGVFKIQPIAIMSNSMKPLFEKGDVVILCKVKENEIKNIKKNDILVYNKDNRYIVHRIIEIIEKDGLRYFRTKGDNNSSPDNDLVEENQVVGIYQMRIKYIGFPSVWLQEKLKN